MLKDEAKFVFGTEQKEAFKQLKMALTTDSVLKLYRVGAETELHTDASRYSLGVILLQKDAENNQLHLVYYASWKTVDAEEKYNSYKLEVLAIVKTLRKFVEYPISYQPIVRHLYKGCPRKTLV